MTTCYYYHPVFQEHITPPGHPECSDRLKAVDKVLGDERFVELDRIQAPAGDEALLSLAHPENYIAAIKAAIPQTGLARIDSDTTASPKSWQSVIHSVGAATEAVDKVVHGTADNVFAALRPPGHHAEKTTAMGFCLFNTIAIAARYAQQAHGLVRVAIVDWDVHHGNGTQDIFESDASVLFASTHQIPLFPGTGNQNETGVGNIFNTPLRAGDDGTVFKQAFNDRVLPAIDNFAPDLILISAGFDAHVRDPLANLMLEAEDFDWVTGKVMDLAEKHCEHRVVSLLEGGYDRVGLGQSVASHVGRLMGKELNINKRAS